MKKISIVSSCYNEEENIKTLCERVKAQMEKYEGKYEWEQILVDNGSTDNSEALMRTLAQEDKRLKIIINSRNFGHIRSPYWAIINATGDAIIYMASDLQDPPELIPEFIEKWEQGYKMALAQKTKSKESPLMFLVRKLFYFFMKKIADDETEQLKQCTGFGLYDKEIIDIIRKIDDPYPYMRGLICDIGFEKALIPFTQPKREHGKTHNNFYTMYDNAMIGVVKHSKMPLRMAAFTGFVIGTLSLLAAFFYLVYKLLFWNSFNVGQAPLVIGLFFFSAVQLFFIGIVGEYVGAIYTRVNKRPVVVEKERINF
ncbi:glycosyltransferase family 2 protein [bacterium]|nr:glycosyltransferase family 2 protein [bacterium]